MKTLGLIGGMSWESTSEYYRIINQTVKEKLGPTHSCRSIIYSVDFAEISRMQHQRDWEGLTAEMVKIARRLEKAGAGLIIICSNTMHIMADVVADKIEVPLLHIVDATAEAIKEQGLKTAGLLGTSFTMEEGFYKERLQDRHNLTTLTPSAPERETVHRIIYEELISGQIKEQSRQEFQEIIQNLKERGAEGIILGCTEIPLLIKAEHSNLPLFDTTLLHARRAVEEILK